MSGHAIDALKYLGAPEAKQACSKCKEEVKISTLRRYNWSEDPDHKELERRICQKCHARAMDKLYDVDQSVDTEEVLYERKNKKRDDP